MKVLTSSLSITLTQEEVFLLLLHYDAHKLWSLKIHTFLVLFSMALLLQVMSCGVGEWFTSGVSCH